MQGRRGWAKEHEALKGYRAEMQEKARQFIPLTEEDLKATGTHRQPLQLPTSAHSKRRTLSRL